MCIAEPHEARGEARKMSGMEGGENCKLEKE